MLGIKKLRELLWGKAGTTSVVPVEVSPTKQREENPYWRWLATLTEDVKCTGASYAIFTTYDGHAGDTFLVQFHRGVFTAGWSLRTLDSYGLEDIYNRKVVRGSLHCSYGIKASDMRGPGAHPKKDHIVVTPNLHNAVVYITNYSHHDMVTLPGYKGIKEITTAYAQIAPYADWNDDKLFHLVTDERGQKWYASLWGIQQLVEGGDWTWVELRLCPGPSYDPDRKVQVPLGPLLTGGHFKLGDLSAIDRLHQPTELTRPIRIKRLEIEKPDGTEAFVHLRPGKMDGTYTRELYSVEVDSEKLYGGKIVNLDKFFMLAWHLAEVKYGLRNNHTKFYIDNIQYLRLDGTYHTSDVAGFATIGAKPYTKVSNEELMQLLTSTHPMNHATSPRFITNTKFPDCAPY